MEKYFGILSSAQLDEILPGVDRSSRGLERAGIRIDRIAHRLTGSPLGRGDWSVVRGLTVLDLGCGSDEFGRDGLFEPHLARLLIANGAQVTGVDLGRNLSSHKGEYRHVQEDIFDRVMTGTLTEVEGLRGQTFDVVHSSMLLGYSVSPTLFYRVVGPELREVSGFRAKMDRFTDLLLEQLKSLTHEGSIVMLEDRHFRRTANTFEELPSIGE